MITISGTHVFPTDKGAPSLEDMAYSLGRVPRFGGHTTRWWPVLLHSLVCLRIAEYYYPGVPRKQLLALVHDGHESVTEDIPTAWKVPEMKRMQALLDTRIWARLGIPHMTLAEEEDIRLVDRAAFHAELWQYGPPGIREYHSLTTPPQFVPEVREIGKTYGAPHMTNGKNSAGVKEFIRQGERLLASCTRLRQPQG
jgi:hypothetical protein